MRIAPIFDRILILPIPDGNVSKGGLLLPAVAQGSKVFAYGDVTAVGTGRVNIEGKVAPLTIKVGDVVMYPRRAGQLVPITDEQGEEIPHVLLREPEIMAVVHDLPRESRISGVDGRLLAMIPTSRGLPDIVFSNRESQDIAEREGWSEPVVDEFEPGDGPQ